MIVSLMMRWSYWARDNKWKTRFLIISFRAMLTALALGSGWMLQQWGYGPGQWLLLTGIIIYFSGVIIYPSKYKGACEKDRISNYLKRKAVSMAITAATAMMFLHIGARLSDVDEQRQQLFFSSQTARGAIARDSSLINKSFPLFQKKKVKSGFFARWKAMRQILKGQMNSAREPKQPLTANQSLGILIVVVIGLMSIFLLGMLSCSLACDGNEAGATILLLLGIPAVVFLAIHVIRNITKRKSKPQLRKEGQS